MPEPIITIKDLRFNYRGVKKPALDGINLEVNKGEFLVIMGPSEAGKSTLASTINSLIPNFFNGKLKGEINVMGRNTREQSVAQMSEIVGMVFQDFEAELFSTNVELEVAFGPENFAEEWDEIKRRIDENLNYVGLDAFRRRPPSTLSGGQKQKLAIASVLALKPKILVMDEPTTDLDPISKMGVFEITHKLCKRDDLTLMIMEHETEEALFADRVALIQEGKIIKIGPTREVLTDVDTMEGMGVMPLGIPKFFKRMGAIELPLTPDEGVQAFQAQGWKVDPVAYENKVAEEKAALAKLTEPIGSLSDGTQIWKITHNGVDTHTIHVHLFNAQLVNRVAWDGMVMAPDANELGWKETIRVNPLEHTIIAFRPTTPTQPFSVPNSVRAIDPTRPLGVELMGPPLGFQDPLANPVTVYNHEISYGWEYVWHCHLLSHEEMDMMHSMGFVTDLVAPTVASNLVGIPTTGQVVLTWDYTPNIQTNFLIMRANDVAGVTGSYIEVGRVARDVFTFTNTAVPAGNYYYQVIASNTVGDWVNYGPAPIVGFPNMSANSAPATSSMITVP